MLIIHCPRTWLKPTRSQCKEGDFPKAERASRKTQAVPLHPELTEEQQKRVIATAVGGNKEIVSSRNGFLLPPNLSAEEIAAAILEMQASSESAAQKRMESYRTWRDKYNADSNFQLFTETLLQVRINENHGV